MRRASRLSLVGSCCVLVLSGCASRDMDEWCAVATEVEADASVPDEQKAKVVAERFSPGSTDVKNVLLAVESAEGSIRYELIEHAARTELGLDDWSCPAMKTVYSAPAPRD